MTTLETLVSIGVHVFALVLLVPLVFARRKEPQSTIAWVLAIIFLPYIGPLLYLIFGPNRVEQKAGRKRRANAAIGGHFPELSPYHHPLGAAGGEADHRDLMLLASRIGATRPTWGNRAEILVDTNRTLALKERAIREAQEHIHVEYYIFEPDETGRHMRDLLIEKARQGVKVRFLYDAVGSMGLKRWFLEPMRQAGIEVARFLPVNVLRRRWVFSLRNHRKILIADGRVGFTGGMNIGDEYLGRNPQLGYWRDTHVMLHGPAVLQLQQVFGEDWYFATDQELTSADLFPPPGEPGDQIAQVIAAGPDRDVEVMHEIYFTAISTARERVLLQTSYFVPTEAIRIALQTAARRGVEVKLLLPARSAHVVCLLAAQSYYDELLASGVEIYEYTRGLLHSKTLTIDGLWSSVGSANMDTRSLRLNFEVGVIFYGRRIAQQLEAIFATDLENSRRLDFDRWKGRSLARRVSENTCRLLSPIL